MTKPPAASLFRLKQKSVKRTARALDQLAQETSVEVDFDGAMAWARSVLKPAGLPANLRARKTKTGSEIELLARVIPNTLEWHAAQVVFYVDGARRHIEHGNASDAVWCATRASKHRWMGFIDQHLTRDFRSGRRSKEGSQRGQEARLRASNTARMHQHYDDLRMTFPERDSSEILETVGAEFNITPGAVRKSLYRRSKK